MKGLPKLSAALGLAFTAFAQAAVKAAAAFEEAAAKLRALTYVPPAVRERRLCGLEARMQVRAGLDPAYAARPDALVQALLTEPASVLGRDALYVRKGDRVRLAAAAMRGWAESRPTDRPLTVWHRAMAGTNIQVCAA